MDYSQYRPRHGAAPFLPKSWPQTPGSVVPRPTGEKGTARFPFIFGLTAVEFRAAPKTTDGLLIAAASKLPTLVTISRSSRLDASPLEIDGQEHFITPDPHRIAE
ncbi:MULTISPECIES: hypothetical protein [unclassified Mesorhizobium]|uniref:hypothetical protein n=1 Tax=unclassified Mesorhizobium TaxID=325217 RepID=UPI00333539DE